MNATLYAFLFPGMPGVFELIIVAGIILLLFGKRLPSAMRSLGQSIVEFKKGINEPDDTAQSSSGPKQSDS